MQFKHPEILFALLALAIPIIVHLFQLRRFKKVAFTNVQMLKNINEQTRKSSKLKKWLTLLARLLMLACAIIAFAQPFMTKTGLLSAKHETVIYLDNSYSMETKSDNGTLLNQAVRDIIENIGEDEPLYLFTNDRTFANTSIKAIKNDLIQLGHSAEQLSYEAVLLKGKNAFSKDPISVKNFILISDFQQKQTFPSFDNDSPETYKLVQLKPKKNENISIDSVYIASIDAKNMEVNAIITNHGNTEETLPVSLFDNENLVAKNSIALNGIGNGNAAFTIPLNSNFNGKLVIDDTGMQYDNVLYFNINEREKAKVLAINQADDVFLRKIFTSDEFEYTSVHYDELNYNDLPKQNLIVLNELKNLSSSLATALKPIADDGSIILIIPSDNIDLTSYNQFFTNFSIPPFQPLNVHEKKVTGINFSHPLLANVFEKKVDNFQYPKTESSYTFGKIQTASVLNFEDSNPFLVQSDHAYVFTAALNDLNSNFKNSPLIVPVLYNIAKQSLKVPELYYNIGTENTIDISAQLQQDDILTLSLDDAKIIPMQQTYTNKVEIKTDEMPDVAGIYTVSNKDIVLQHLSFNYGRKESQLNYMDLSRYDDVNKSTSVASTINDIKSVSNVDELWKWFVIFAVFFLIVEMLILKLLK